LKTYRLFGLRLESSIEFPELPADPSDESADVRLSVVAPGATADRTEDEWAAVIARLRGDRVGDDWFGVEGEVAWFDWPGVARVRIADGETIEVDPCEGVDRAGLRTAILGPVFSVLLTQRGLYPLHASGVVVNGEAIAFSAASGSGKSTLALTMHDRGHAFLSDDVVAVDVDALPIRIAPAFPQVKMMPDLIEHRGDDERAMPFVSPVDDKRARATTALGSIEPLPLARVYLIEDGEPDLIGPLSIKEAFFAALGNGHRPILQQRAVGPDEVMRRASVLAEQVPFFRLRRLRGLDRLDERARRIEAHAER